MKLSHLTAISPVDGRYFEYVKSLRNIFSEFSLLKYRLIIEIEWFKKISECEKINDIEPLISEEKIFLNNILNNFSLKDAIEIKNIERKTNHDIKAVEYFLKKKFSLMKSLDEKKEFIHFACTSEDINNLSYALMIIKTRNEIIIPIWYKIIKNIVSFSKKYKNFPIISRTHGQPATPSTLGKEFCNFSYRLIRQFNQLKKIKILGKINGTVGNYNAHFISYPNVDWINFSKEFVNSLGIELNLFTTQIEPHDYISEILHCFSRFNNILINFNRDIWGYLSINFFKNKYNKGKIGSSVMPHKINPIDFENSEGNLELSNAILNHLSNKLSISRWQRDLTDSTSLRNIGLAISYSFIAYKKFLNGISNLEINKFNIKSDLRSHWEVLSEPIQTLMRRNKIKNSYELVKDFLIKKDLDPETLKSFVENLKIKNSDKNILKNITPEKYIGLSTLLVDCIEKYFNNIDK
ncbi:purB [Wigglesworthia glossinidia endosymbiont of Glossina brevipalpis]|uniref:Adenylosuccinate lyase n=1 Tax=Wigglesworthia glossinidia brevipalpis TaxID=36870 RepID=Q8D398_WIGBR|nr:purB [Wigglesworthia glossinidia endosymbiont of Glossina brevipalpis]